MRKDFWYATSILVGAIVGVGLFGIPYVSVRSGFWVGTAYIIVLALAVLLVHLLYGEVEERTEGHHRLTGHAERYLGRLGKWLVGTAVLVGGYGALVAYLVIAGEFLDIIFPEISTPYIWTVVFWTVGSLAIWRGLRLVSRGELLMTLALIGTMIFIVGKSVMHIVPDNFYSIGNIGDIFSPYGVVIFALLGVNAIPEVRAMLSVDGKRFRSVIIVGTLIPAALYLLFNAAVVGVSGSGTTEEAIRGLVPILGSTVAKVGALFGFLAVATSFLVIGLNIKNTFVYDWKLHVAPSVMLTVLVPLGLFLIGVREFIAIIGVTGALLGAITIPVIIWIYIRAKKMGKRKPGFVISVPRIVLYIVGALFVIGGVYEVIRFITG